MMTEDRTRFEVLLEDIHTQVKGVAEAHVGLVQRLDRMEARFETRFDTLETHLTVLTVKVNGLDTRVGRLEIKVDGLETKVDGLEVFASDAQRRLKRIEGHLQLNGAVTRAAVAKHAAPKHAAAKRRKS